MIHEVTHTTVTCPQCGAKPQEPCKAKQYGPHLARCVEAATVFRILNAEAIKSLAAGDKKKKPNTEDLLVESP